MAGWVIANIKITNPDGFAEYRDLVPQTISDIFFPLLKVF